jgi:hypothetical protein
VVRAEQSAQTGWRPLDHDHSIGQTFVAREDGLAGLQFFLTPHEPGDGTIILHLRADSQTEDDLAVASLSTASVTAPGFYTFLFPPQTASRRQYYYTYLEIEGQGSLQVGHASGDAYLDGALHENHLPIDAQSTFGLVYAAKWLTLGLARQIVGWAGLLLVGLFLYALPGWGLLSLLWPGWDRLRWPEKLGLALGSSLAVYPLLLLWSDLIGLHLGAFYAWAPPVAGLVGLIYKNWRPGKLRLNAPWPALRFPDLVGLLQIDWSDVTWAIVTIIIIGTRCWALRDIDLPMWGDSVHHTIITQLIVEHNGLFNEWRPYAESSTFTYHFGFHSTAAVFHWLTGLSVSRSVLWVGQLVNTLAIISLYPLATRVGKNSWAGVVTMVVAGLLSPMPMYYTNWGRYTQLAGQVILPITIWCLWDTLERLGQPGLGPGASSKFWSLHRELLPAIILITGLALTHYRVLALALTFLGAGWLLLLRRSNLKPMILQIFWLGAGSGGLFLPWLQRIYNSKLMQVYSAQVTTIPSQAVDSTQQYNAIGDLSTFLPLMIWVLLPIAAGIGIWRRERGSILISLWVYLTLLVTNPNWLGLPGAGVITNFAIFIAAYQPASLLLGAQAGWLIEKVAGPPPTTEQNATRAKHNNLRAHLVSATTCICILGLGLWGAWHRASDVQPVLGALATRPDLRAAGWIRDHTSETSFFLPNAFFAYNDTVVVGADGGWWLPFLTRRASTLPPITYASEQSQSSDYYERVNQLYRELLQKGIDHPDVLQLLRDRNIAYVYIGQRQGRVNNPNPVIEPSRLASHPAFQVVYHQDRVWIFELKK